MLRAAKEKRSITKIWRARSARKTSRNGPLKPPSSNKEEEDEDKEEYVGSTIASTEDGPPGYKDDEGCEDNHEDDHEDTALYDAKDNEE